MADLGFGKSFGALDKAFDGMAKLAFVGIAAIVVMTVTVLVCTTWWVWHHVSTH